MLPVSPMIEEMFTIRPDPRSIMCGRTACDMKKAPDRLTSITLCQSSSVIFSTVLSIVIPALLTRMSSRPCCSITSATVRRQSSAEPMLPWWALPFRPSWASLLDERLGRLAVAAVAGRDVRALLGQAVADRRPDAPGAAGDESDSALQARAPDG